MPFVDFLKATVLASAGAATALAAVTVAAGQADGTTWQLIAAAGWWLVAALTGALLGRRATTNPPIARLLASARATTALPEQRPGRILVNRLWPLLTSSIGAGALAVVAPQIPAIACGFTIIWALAWRRQDAAVAAIEDRDGARFYVEPTSPFSAIRLVRAPSFRAHRPTVNGSGRLPAGYRKSEASPTKAGASTSAGR